MKVGTDGVLLGSWVVINTKAEVKELYNNLSKEEICVGLNCFKTTPRHCEIIIDIKAKILTGILIKFKIGRYFLYKLSRNIVDEKKTYWVRIWYAISIGNW